MATVGVEGAANLAVVKKKNPRVEQFKFDLKLLVGNKLAFVGTTIVLFYFIIAILDSVYPQYLGVPNISSMTVFTANNGLPNRYPIPIFSSVSPYGGPGWWYWLGGTFYNFPILPSMLAALKIDLTVSLIVVLTGIAIGMVVGSVAGYLGGVVDEIVMRVTDVFFSVPYLILAIVLVAEIGRNLNSVVISLIIIWWPIYARLSRGLALTIKSQNFIEAAKASGSSRLRNIFSHVMPNSLSPIFVQFSLDLGTIVLVIANLYFLGVSFTAGSGLFTPELGYMMNGPNEQILAYLTSGYWWPGLIPGLFLLLFTVSVNLMGDGLRDILDPKLRR